MTHATPHLARRLKVVLTESMTSWIDHRASSKGTALAFYTLFSMTPILVLSIAFAGYVFGAEAAQGEIVVQVQGLVGPNGAQVIQALLAAARDPDSGLVATLVASVLLLVGATSVFVELKGSLDELWGIGKPGQSAFRVLLRTRLLSFGMVLVLAFLLLVSLVVSSVLAMLERHAGGVLGGSAVALATISLHHFIRRHSLHVCSHLQDPAGRTADVARRLDRCRLHGGAVQPGKICDRFVSGQQRRGIELWCRRIADRVAAMGVLLSTNFLSGGGVHAALCFVVRQPAA